MTTTPDPWLDELINEVGVVPPDRSNANARESLMDAARTSLVDATMAQNATLAASSARPKNAVWQAISALAGSKDALTSFLIGSTRRPTRGVIAVERCADCLASAVGSSRSLSSEVGHHGWRRWTTWYRGLALAN
jgi:hypothetical protein